jgi:transcriptional regulator with XRE-family HTH domain
MYGHAMPRSSQAARSLPSPVLRALIRLGADVAVARKRRGISQRLMAERMLVSLPTLQRLEAGDPTVGLAVLASALFVLGLADRLEQLADPASDAFALSRDLERLPKAIHPAKRPELDF